MDLLIVDGEGVREVEFKYDVVGIRGEVDDVLILRQSVSALV